MHKINFDCVLYELGGALDGSDVLIGAKADMHRGALLLSHPIEHGTHHHYHHREHYLTSSPPFCYQCSPLNFTIVLPSLALTPPFLTLHFFSSPLHSVLSISNMLILNLFFPPLPGIVQSWSDMERLWSHVYAKENLNVPSEDHPV